MRLIDANKIDFNEVFKGQSDFAKDTREAAQTLIDNQPSVDAAPVVRGEWEYDIWLDTYICNRCLKTFRHRTRYCPDCGADMRKSDCI